MGLFGFVNSQLLKNIEWLDDTSNTLVYRFPMNGKKIMCGSNLTVRESQVAIFVHNGKIADIFESGIHKLNTSDLPILSKLLAWPTGFKSPFTAEVYFVNTKQFINQKWGTSNPITMRDDQYGQVRIKGYGTFSYRIYHPEQLLKELLGTNRSLKTEDIIEYMKSILVAGISDTIAESKISVLDLAANLMEFNDICKKQVGKKFEELGLELVNLICENFSFPEEVEKAIDTSTSMNIMNNTMDTYVKYQAANAMRESASNGNNFTSAGMGISAGMAVGNMFANSISSTMNQQTNGGKVCPNCNTQNTQNSKFCCNCGYNFSASVCPGCSMKIAPGTKFCPNCGRKI